MSGSIRLGKIAGISIELHFTWFIIFALVALGITLKLPELVPGIETGARWVLGISLTLAFFFCLFLHELAHSLVAKRLGIGIAGITFFVFGGVSRMTSEPKSAGDELKMAAAGPLTSIFLGGLFVAAWYVARLVGASQALVVGLGGLGFINLALAGFNLVPGFPLDGGRLLRAIIWATTGDLQQATYIASTAGQGFAYLLIAFGVFSLFARDWNGLWFILLGWFLLDAARSSYQQQVLRSALSGVRVREIMTSGVITIPPEMTLQQAVDDYFLRMNYAAFPVADGGNIRGILTLPHVRQVPRERWAYTRAIEAIEPMDGNQWMHPDQDAWEALSTMASQGTGRMLVAEHGQLLGIISRTDIMRFLRVKMELGI